MEEEEILVRKSGDYLEICCGDMLTHEEAAIVANQLLEALGWTRTFDGEECQVWAKPIGKGGIGL